MDNKQIFDVSRPGSTAASPNSKPVITGSQSPLTDPMFTGRQPFAGDQAPVPVAMPGQVVSAGSVQNVSAAPNNQVPNLMNSDMVNNNSAQQMPQNLTPNGMNTGGQFSDQPQDDGLNHQLVHDQPIYGHVGKPKKGKKVLIFLFVLILLGGGGAAGWYFFIKKDKKETPVVQPAVVQPKTEAVSKTLYKSNLFGFSLDNKYGWKITEKDDGPIVEKQTNGMHFATVTFDINQEHVLKIMSGGTSKGGECVAGKDDKPFEPGNDCSSYELTESTKLDNKIVPEKSRETNFNGIYLEKYSYMSSTDSTAFKLVGISSTTKDDQGKELRYELNTPVVGTSYPYTSIALKDRIVYIKLVDKEDKPVQLSDQDLDRVYEVLKTFKLVQE